MPTESLSKLDVVWLPSPWSPRTLSFEFLFSWDVTQGFFLRPAPSGVPNPLCALIDALRTAGFDSKLRAGQSLNSLGLSRSREHGLRPEQDHLFLHPLGDGTVRVTGSLLGEQIARGPFPGLFADELADLIARLALVEID